MKTRSGYVSLLAMAFSLGLAIIGTTLAATLAEHVRSASSQERRLRADLRLESAANGVLARMVAGIPTPAELHGVAVLVAHPMTKVDPVMDPPSEVAQALRSIGIEDAQDVELHDAGGLVSASSALRLSARQEDCLRRTMTFGRAPAERAPEGLKPSAMAGDQVDVRVSLAQDGRDEVLWVRARFTGDERGWSLHDHRRLSGEATCRA